VSFVPILNSACSDDPKLTVRGILQAATTPSSSSARLPGAFSSLGTP
jgi:hypothetical protein